jgi:hypothetical protein
MSRALLLEAEAKFPTHRTNGVKDELAWAKRFKYRHEHGDPDVKKFQVDAAREALKRAGEDGSD